MWTLLIIASFNSQAIAIDHIDGFQTQEIIDGLDPYAATRRAIVRAAAEIGRNK
jgi:hypothetical protein